MNPFSCLIIDDIFMNRILLKEIVKGFCTQIYEADNGKTAIELLQTHKINIVFMDIEMPIMNGLETTKYIRRRLSSPLCNIPIIAITAYNPEDFFDDYKDAGFNHLLTKPYSFSKIQTIVKALSL
ncbi:MAG: hypothetical protein A2W99_04550 [Bacteroidetes bacterium GWF2_33_16]|nr:MAG: hypothetical protein A2X00_17070 [Bacteroidetes bacterium GWE2_32_14]OFY05940.1 MAG: hypothetical protein A2W99_04550 [Bacteroidetes bacterium GWF2_33_16]